jgi:hypothetical protein
MISYKEEAVMHSNHVKAKYIVVLPCGQIYAGSDFELMQKVVDNNECFVVKGDLKKTVKASKTKETKQ